MPFDPLAAARDFPLIDRGDNVYLDNAATTQKPTAVLDAVRRYYETTNANVHRAAHALSDAATQAFESARADVARWINARTTAEVVWTRGTTEGINLVAQSHGGPALGPGDRVLITELEHHSNIVPWQIACARTGATLAAAKITPEGGIDLDDFDAKLDQDTKIVAFGHVSNALGTVNPVRDLVARARAADAVTVVDGAQAMAHFRVDVQELGCDFYAFSGHKMYGPTGIGVLYGREELLEAMPPWQAGGEMIEEVTIEATTYARLPFKFEAGTPNIAGAIGLGAAIRYLEGIDARALASHEDRLLRTATSRLSQVEGVRILGTAPDKGPVLSFLMDGGHPHDVGTLLDQQGIAVRTGHHCAMPLMQRLSVPGTVRASFGLYNSLTDVERLVAGVHKTRSFL
ncbi:MAG: SufS family cysteine desulfurase [Gammaproteobacteria bacterium]|nr:SufS family cysteine desulfurase [Gammaproteobacteria bacterium]